MDESRETLEIRANELSIVAQEGITVIPQVNQQYLRNIEEQNRQLRIALCEIIHQNEELWARNAELEAWHEFFDDGINDFN
jgi:hypothetical protein